MWSTRVWRPWTRWHTSTCATTAWIRWTWAPLATWRFCTASATSWGRWRSVASRCARWTAAATVSQAKTLMSCAYSLCVYKVPRSEKQLIVVCLFLFAHRSNNSERISGPQPHDTHGPIAVSYGFEQGDSDAAVARICVETFGSKLIYWLHLNGRCWIFTLSLKSVTPKFDWTNISLWNEDISVWG